MSRAPVGRPVTTEPELSPDVAGRRGLRKGWSTGTCASAAAKAAAVGLAGGQAPAAVEVGLPDGSRARFAVEEAAPGHAVVLKDAGDDPDCTHGARMTADVGWAPPGAGCCQLLGGEGIGVITRLGLGLAIGAPAVNPVPRRMILAALAEATGRPLVVSLSVPGGEDMAAQTTNARLGIVGGISVLGTTGIVRPFSTASYRASVVQQVDVAAAQGERTMVLATGHRSEQAAMRLRPELDEVCFVEVGDFTGIALRRVARSGMKSAVLVAMAGKITKLAAGVMMTHFHRSEVDTELLAALAVEASAPPPVLEAATATATARHFFEACLEAGTLEPLAALCRRARAACEAHTGGALKVEVVMVDFEGDRIVARA